MTRRPLRFALLADGTSDRALVHIIRWVIVQHRPEIEIAEPGFRSRDGRLAMLDEMKRTISSFEPDILFVHRDAERLDPELRRGEIPDLSGGLVRVVPVRMTEAWLLFDDRAIRRAANNPAGTAVLDLPALRRVEDLADPKARLREALLAAAEVSGRRRKRFHRDLSSIVQRVAELIKDFAPLRELPAFSRFEHDCRKALEA